VVTATIDNTGDDDDEKLIETAASHYVQIVTMSL
jgi:hypothetical protein